MGFADADDKCSIDAAQVVITILLNKSTMQLKTWRIIRENAIHKFTLSQENHCFMPITSVLI